MILLFVLLLILSSLFILMKSGVLSIKIIHLSFSFPQIFFSIESIKYVQIFKNIEEPFVNKLQCSYFQLIYSSLKLNFFQH